MNTNLIAINIISVLISGLSNSEKDTLKLVEKQCKTTFATFFGKKNLPSLGFMPVYPSVDGKSSPLSKAFYLGYHWLRIKRRANSNFLNAIDALMNEALERDPRYTNVLRDAYLREQRRMSEIREAEEEAKGKERDKRPYDPLTSVMRD